MPFIYSRIISWARITILARQLALEPLAQRAPVVPRKLFRHDLDYRNRVARGVASAAPQALPRRSDEARHAAELSGRLFQEILESFLRNGLAFPGLFRQQDLDEI